MGELSSWLSLREPADAEARADHLMRVLVARLPPDRPVRIVDLGAGTGANVRYLSPRLPMKQQWQLVDQDSSLLEQARRRLEGSGRASIETCQMNLGTLSGAVFAGRDVVTASALLDLVSEPWLWSLAAHCRAAGVAIALFALTYDGYSRCVQHESEDEEVRTLMNTHQRRNDKGFGTAAGPDAAAAAVRAFAAAGYRVQRAPSDWIIGPDAPDLERQLIQGWVEAAEEIAPDRSAALRAWLARRLDHVRAGRSRIVVGHEDLLAFR